MENSKSDISVFEIVYFCGFVLSSIFFFVALVLGTNFSHLPGDILAVFFNIFGYFLLSLLFALAWPITLPFMIVSILIA